MSQGPVTKVVLSVDVACFTLAGGALQLLLVQREAEPFAGDWALPGGTVGRDETLEAAALSVLARRTGVQNAYLEQLYTFGDPDRDPRDRAVSVAYFSLLSTRPAPLAGEGVLAAAWHGVGTTPPLAFDHAAIAQYARRRLAQKIEDTPLAFELLPETFTLAELRAVHEAVTGRPYDPSNFAKQMLTRWDLAPVPGVRDRRSRRPARLFRYIGERETAERPEAALQVAG